MNRRRFLGVAGALVGLGIAFLAGQQVSRKPPPTASVGKKGCDITITSPALDSAHAVTLRSGDSLTVAISGTARRCPSSTVSLYKSENGGGETSLGTTSTNASGVWSYNLVATNQVSTLFSARMTAGTIITQAQATVKADTTLPKVVVTAPAGDDWGVLRIVASKGDAGCGSGGNGHVDDGEKGWVSDEACADGGQVTPSVTVTGAAGGFLYVTYGGVVLADAGVGASPQTFGLAELGQLTLPEFSRADLTFTAVSDAGVTSKTLSTRVFTITPGAVGGPDGGLWISRIIDGRRATVALDYVLPTVPPGITAAHIEGIWTTSSVLTAGAAGTTVRTAANVTTSATLLADPPTANRGGVSIQPCMADGGAPVVLWCDTVAGVKADAGVRIPIYRVTDGGTCAAAISAFPSLVPIYSIFADNEDGGLSVGLAGAHQTTCAQLVYGVKPIYCVAENGFANVTPSDIGMCVDWKTQGQPGHNAYIARATNGRFGEYGSTGVKHDCDLVDETTTPQTWTCDGVTYHSGDRRSFIFDGLPPLNAYQFNLLAVY